MSSGMSAAAATAPSPSTLILGALSYCSQQINNYFAKSLKNRSMNTYRAMNAGLAVLFAVSSNLSSEPNQQRLLLNRAWSYLASAIIAPDAHPTARTFVVASSISNLAETKTAFGNNQEISAELSLDLYFGNPLILFSHAGPALDDLFQAQVQAEVAKKLEEHVGAAVTDALADNEEQIKAAVARKINAKDFSQPGRCQQETFALAISDEHT